MMALPMKDYDLRINIQINEAGNYSSGLRVDETLTITANGFLELSRVLVRFHDLAMVLREEQAARFEFVKGTLEFYGHNQSRAARALRVHRNTLRRIIIDMEHHGIDAGRRQPRSAAAPARKKTA